MDYPEEATETEAAELNQVAATARAGAASPAAGGLLQAYVGDQVDAIARGEQSLRQGEDAVHPTRVATRRLRSLLRVFGRLFDGDAASALDEDLAWYAGVLGAVRERQVLRARLAAIGTVAEADAETETETETETGTETGTDAETETDAEADGADLDAGPEDALRVALALIDERLSVEEGRSRDDLVAALEGDKYGALVQSLTQWRSNPPLTEAATGEAEQLRSYVRAAGRAADKRLARSTARQQDPEALHRARKAAKRARYAAEVAQSILGEKAAKSSLNHYKAVQEALGEHQDSADAAGLLVRLRTEVGDSDPELTAAYDVLLERERTAAQHALTQAIALAP